MRRCGNMASVLEICENLEFYFNVFDSPHDDGREEAEKGGGNVKADYFL